MKLPFAVSGKGNSLCLTATEVINKGSVIEVCPLIFSPKKEEFSLKKTHLVRYFFPWNSEMLCYLLGYGGLISQSRNPNVTYLFDYERKEVRVVATQTITYGEVLSVPFSEHNPVESRVYRKNKGKIENSEPVSLELPFEIGQSPSLGIRSLLASKDIPQGTRIECCPAILFSVDAEEYIDHTILVKYYFDWSADNNAVCFGYGSLMNHSECPNVQFHLRKKTREIEFVTIVDVKKGEDLMISYRGYGDDQAEGNLEDHYFDYDEHLQITP